MSRHNIPPAVIERQFQAADPAMSVFVSANAGSGKTHVLAQRVINLLLGGTDPATILCITYTKAAAANMETRVYQELARWIALDDPALDEAIRRISALPVTAALRARARRLFALALETPGGLKVQTIHAFCTRLLHQFPFEADVAARFSVLEDSTGKMLLEQLTVDVLQDAAAAPDSTLGRALAASIGFAADQTFKDVIADAIAQRRKLEDWLARAGSLEAAIAELSHALGVAPDDTLAAAERDYFNGPHLPETDWPAFAAFLSASTTATDKKTVDIFRTLPRLSGRGRIDTYVSIFLTQDNAPRKAVITKKFADANPQWTDRLTAEQERIVALAAREMALTARERTRAMLTIAFEVIRRYHAAKDQRALLDYDDLIDKTLALFQASSAAWVLYKLDAGIDHVLIDEAQDTSPRQWDIIKTIVSEFTPGGARPNTPRTLFAVGDEKQSIYSFQGADPREFNAMRLHFERQFRHAELGFGHVRLEHSFRSGANVLQSVDRVFHDQAIFASITADVAGMHEHKALPDAAPGVVELWPLIAPDDKEDIEGWDAPLDAVNHDSPAAKLARDIAATVTAWQRAGTQPGDVLILVRQRNALFESIIRELKQAGIAVAGADRLVLTDHIAVMDLLVLADALLLPDDDLALATVLRSPLFGFSEEQLFDLAWKRDGSLWAALHARAAGDATCADAAREIDRLRTAAIDQSPFTFYANLLANGGRRRILARLGLEAADAIDEFLNLALDYERRETPSLQGFVHWLRSAQNEIKRDMELARNEVRVMTVHGAKGLEAKNVILADTTGKPTGPRDPRLMALPLANAAPGAQAIVWAGARDNDAGAMPQARAAAQDAAQDEYRRLLYVAMTRAAERLVVCGMHGEKKPAAGCWYELIENALAGESETVTSEAGIEGVRRFVKVPPTAPVLVDNTGKAQTANDGARRIAPPRWLSQKATHRTVAPTLVRPSGDGQNDNQAAEQNSGAIARTDALRRGTLVHRLLQSLPEIADARRTDAAARYLARNATNLSDGARDEIAANALRILAHRDFAPLFGPGSRGEVPIVGRITLPGGREIVVSGQIDRLLVTPETILIADYKTNRNPPRTLQDLLSRIPGYVSQLALYRAVLAKLYPARPLRAALVWTDVPDFMEISDELLDASLSQVTSP